MSDGWETSLLCLRCLCSAAFPSLQRGDSDAPFFSAGSWAAFRECKMRYLFLSRPGDKLYRVKVTISKLLFRRWRTDEKYEFCTGVDAPPRNAARAIKFS